MNYGTRYLSVAEDVEEETPLHGVINEEEAKTRTAKQVFIGGESDLIGSIIDVFSSRLLRKIGKI